MYKCASGHTTYYFKGNKITKIKFNRDNLKVKTDLKNPKQSFQKLPKTYQYASVIKLDENNLYQKPLRSQVI